jgi:hypothetical protein
MPSTNGVIETICIAPRAGAPMQAMAKVELVAGRGIRGDRYFDGIGSFSKNPQRQVTLINMRFVDGSGFGILETRRSFGVRGTELMWLIGREFDLGSGRLRGVKYCDPCRRPSKLAKKTLKFEEIFEDAGGLVAEVIQDGWVEVGDLLVPPSKQY